MHVLINLHVILNGRVGGEENFFHCSRCDMCLGIQLKDSHKVGGVPYYSSGLSLRLLGGQRFPLAATLLNLGYFDKQTRQR